MTAATTSYDAARYARWCDADWVQTPWMAHDDLPEEPEVDGGPLDFSGAEEPAIRFDSQAHWLQSCLKRLVAPDLAVDGSPGSRSRAATKEFQRRVREFVATATLSADGVAGPATIAALEAATGTWAPDHGAVAAPTRVGAVGVTRLRDDRVRIDALGRVVDLKFATRERKGVDGDIFVDPHGLARIEPVPAPDALAELGLDPLEAAVLRATGFGGPGSVATDGPGLVTIGFGFDGRGGGLAALLAAIEEDSSAREVLAELLAPLGMTAVYADYERFDPASGTMVARAGFELVLTDGDATIRGDEAWAVVRGQPHRLGALALAAADPRVARVQAQVWRAAHDRLRCARADGSLTVGHMLRSELGAAVAVLLARRGLLAFQTWLLEQLRSLAGHFAGVALADPDAWATDPRLEAAVIAAGCGRLDAAALALLSGLRKPMGAAVNRARPASAAGPPPAGDGYVEKRVKVSTYGTLAADSKLLVAVPAASPGAKRLHVVAAAALARMSEAAERDLGIALKLASAWRAHRWTSRAQYEATLIKRFGSIAEGKRWLGFDSPHETGLAIDIGVGGLWPSRSTAEAQKRQPLHQWLVARAWEFGFYPYKVEPWHWECPLGLKAFKTGVAAPEEPLPAEPLSFSTDAEDEEALEDADLEEQPTI